MIFFCLDRTVALFRSDTQTLSFISQSARIMMSEQAGEAAALDESHSECLSFRSEVSFSHLHNVFLLHVSSFLQLCCCC